MGLNMEAIKARLNKLNEPRGGGSGSNTSYLKINDGRNVVRVLPPREGSESFEQEVFVHYGVGKTQNDNGKTVTCPTTHGEDKACPICEASKALFKLSKKKDDRYEKEAKRMGRKKRVYYNVISRDEDLSLYSFKDGKWYKTEEGKEPVEESPVKVMNSGVGVLKAIFGLIVDPEYGDVTDPTEGLDLIITKSGSGLDTKYEVKSVRKESPIGLDNWETALTDLTVFARTKTYEEITAIVNGEATPASSSKADEAEEEKPTPRKTEDPAKTEVKEPEDADDDNADDDDEEAAIEAALRRRREAKGE